MLKSRLVRPLAALVTVSVLMVGAAACSSSNTDTSADRGASGSGCDTRFGCAKEAALFQVRNTSDVDLTLRARNIVDVQDSDRAGLALVVPARSTSPVVSVHLGDDGLIGSTGVVPGGFRGGWTWSVESNGSVSQAFVELSLNWDYDMGLGSFDGWSEVGAALPLHYSSQTTPVALRQIIGAMKWTAVGSFVESWDEANEPVMSWTFAPAA